MAFRWILHQLVRIFTTHFFLSQVGHNLDKAEKVRLPRLCENYCWQMEPPWNPVKFSDMGSTAMDFCIDCLMVFGSVLLSFLPNPSSPTVHDMMEQMGKVSSSVLGKEFPQCTQPLLPVVPHEAVQEVWKGKVHLNQKKKCDYRIWLWLAEHVPFNVHFPFDFARNPFLLMARTR